LSGAVSTAVNLSVEALIARHPLRSVNAGAGRIAYREAGAGTALVLLHGIGSGSGSWVHQLDALSTRFRVIAWDAPGYGDSTHLPNEAPAAADYAGALGSLLGALSIERAALIGHSLGALIAARHSAGAPARVERLALLNPARGYGNAPPEVRTRRLEERLAAMDRLGPLRHAEERSPALLAPQASAAARALVVWNSARLDPRGYAQAARMLAGADIHADAPLYGGPVLVACGVEDWVTPEAGCRDIAARFPHAEYRSIAGVGHASYIEDSSAVNELMLTFLTSPRRS
jgi:pimeloyl-ACP methyl ester carboxylesterase